MVNTYWYLMINISLLKVNQLWSLGTLVPSYYVAVTQIVLLANCILSDYLHNNNVGVLQMDLNYN